MWDEKIRIVFCDAKAGTGKTTLAVGAANLLCKYNLYTGTTYIVSPNCEGQLGMLPGSLEEKVDPYGTPLYQALMECGEQPERAVVQNGCAGTKSGGWIEFIPETYLRGANFKERVVVIDEAQNYSLASLKKTLTRCHDTSKIIVIGHSGQRDAHLSGESAFSRYSKHFNGDERAFCCELTQNYRGWISNHADELF